MSQVKERPILMNGAMVRATLLDVNPKTQTRRLVKGFALECLEPGGFTPEYVAMRENGNSKLGYPGDRMYVRENFCHIYDSNKEPGTREPEDVAYMADNMQPDPYVYGPWKSSIHMPRWASRLDLEITTVRIQLLQEISDADAIAEGIECIANNYGNGPAYRDYRMKCPDDTTEWFACPIRSFQTLWESINGPGSWDANPWVWVVEFKRVVGK